jgi:hypothetical protein
LADGWLTFHKEEATMHINVSPGTLAALAFIGFLVAIAFTR